MLRINVDVPNSAPEIFASGFRNPWRFSFDRLTGQLYAGDVGQSAREEVDIVTQGGNYGWRVWEGTFCTGLGPASCSAAGFIPPIAEYVNTGPDGRCAIIGGYVYRGAQGSLPYGAYIYGDLCSGEIFMLKDGVQTLLLATTLQLSSFGEDESGELYVLNLNGSIFRLTNPDAVFASQRPYATANAPFVASTAGSSDTQTRGYARIQPDIGQPVPSGMAIFGVQQRGVLTSEASVPISRPILTGRVFAEVSSNVNTGIALANPNDQAATVSFYFTDANGTRLRDGATTLAPRQQIAVFLTEPPFDVVGPMLGSFTFTSSVPIAAVALRGFTNERSDFLITTLPIAEPEATAPDSSTIAHFADGGGWTTQVVLVNPSDAAINGTVQFVGQNGAVIRTVGYSLAANSATRIVTAGLTREIQTGSVRIQSPAFAFAIFSFKSNGVTVTEAGIPALPSGSFFQTYVESGAGIRSGIAIANPAASVANVRWKSAG